MLFLLLPLLPLLASPDDGAPATVEEMIRICRERSARHREALASRLEAILAKAESGGDESAIGALVALGPETASLLLSHLEPKEGDETGPRKARLCAVALARLAPAEALPELLRILREGSKAGRLHAAALLGILGGEEATAALLEILANPDPDLRRTAVASLGRLRAAGAGGRLAALLSSADPALAAAILGALKSIGSPEAVPAVAIFLDSPQGGPLLSDALDYLAAVRGRAALPVVLRLLRSSTNVGNTIRLLQGTGAIASPGDKEVLAALREFLDEGKVKSWDVRAEAAFALAALGDDGGAKGLLREYNAWIAANPKLENAYAGRGKIYLRLGKWGEALRDYQEAIRFAKGERDDAEWYVDAARALCRLNREREAVSMLKRSGLSARALARYRDLPEFEELRKNEKYRSVWED